MGISFHITIDDLKLRNEISNKAANVCISNGINNLNGLIEHYLVHKSFKNLLNCGLKTNKELEQLIKKHNYFNNLLEQKLEYIFFANLSNVSLKKIKEFQLKQHINFKLRDFIFSNNVNLIDNQDSNIVYSYKIILKNIEFVSAGNINYDFNNIINNIDVYKKIKINSIYNYYYNKLNIRILNYFKKIKVEHCSDFFNWYNEKKDLDTIKFIGSKNKKDLQKFIENLIFEVFYIILSKKSDDQILLERYVSHNFNEFYELDFNNEEIITKDEKLNVLIFFDVNKSKIFGKHLRYFEYSKENYSRKFKLTKERARQILNNDKVKILNKIKLINEGFNKKKIIVTKFLDNYNFFDHSSLVENKSLFIKKLFFLILNNNLLPNFNVIDPNKIIKSLNLTHLQKRKFKLNKFLIIDKKYDSIKIQNLIEKIYFEISKANFIKYVITDSIEVYLIKEIIKEFFYDSIGFSIVDNKKYIFSQKNVSYCYLTLKYYNKNTHLDIIYSYILHNDDYLKIPDKSSIRQTLINHKDLFYSIGKTSTYGLNELNIDNSVATKSIKEECINILIKNKKPVHKIFIYKNLSKRRPGTKMRSIETILNQEDKIFDNSDGFYWLLENRNKIEKPINHLTANKIKRNIIKKHFLENMWIEKNKILKLFKNEMTDYQGDHFLSEDFVEYGTKVTLKYNNYDKIIKLFEEDERILDFLKNKYEQLDNSKKNQFKIELKAHFDKLNISLSMLSLNKSLNYFLS